MACRALPSWARRRACLLFMWLPPQSGKRGRYAYSWVKQTEASIQSRLVHAFIVQSTRVLLDVSRLSLFGWAVLARAGRYPSAEFDASTRAHSLPPSQTDVVLGMVVTCPSVACCGRLSMARATRMAPTPSYRCQPRPRPSAAVRAGCPAYPPPSPSTTAAHAPSMPSIRRSEPAFAHPQRPHISGRARAGRHRRPAHATRERPVRQLAAAAGRRSSTDAMKGTEEPPTPLHLPPPATGAVPGPPRSQAGCRRAGRPSTSPASSPPSATPGSGTGCGHPRTPPPPPPPPPLACAPPPGWCRRGACRRAPTARPRPRCWQRPG